MAVRILSRFPCGGMGDFGRNRLLAGLVDIPAGELTLQDMESFNDQPIARGMGDTATDAIKTMLPLQWRTPRSG